MPTAEEFEAVLQDIADRSLLDILEINKALAEAWPDPKDREAWRLWLRGRRSSLHKACVLSPEEFIKRVDEIPFFDAAARNPLVNEMQKGIQSWIPIGCIEDIIYRLLPDSLDLQPHSSSRTGSSSRSSSSASTRRCSPGSPRVLPASAWPTCRRSRQTPPSPTMSRPPASLSSSSANWST